MALCPSFPEHDVQHAIEEADIGARQNGQMQVAQLRSVGLARVYANDFKVWILLPSHFDASEQNRVRKGCVGARNEEAIGMINVFVACGGGVCTQSHFVASNG